MTPLRVLCAREVQRSLQESVFELLRQKIEKLGLAGRYDVQKTVILGDLGSRFMFTGLLDHTSESIKSFEGINIAWIEEAQAVSARSIEILVPTIRAPGSQLWWSWNPRHKTDPVDVMFRQGEPPPRSYVRRVSRADNPWFPPELAEEADAMRKRNPALYRHVWEGEYRQEVENPLWTRALLDACIVREVPEMRRVVVGVDPSGGNDMQGIVAAGLGVDGIAYALRDASCRLTPAGWGRRVVETAAAFGADAIVVERNFGGDMARDVIARLQPPCRIVDVTASRGKAIRAEPIAALYEQGRIKHHGPMPDLEDQMTLMTPAGYEGDGSPDRLDAAVWAFTELGLTAPKPTVFVL